MQKNPSAIFGRQRRRSYRSSSAKRRTRPTSRRIMPLPSHPRCPAEQNGPCASLCPTAPPTDRLASGGMRSGDVPAPAPRLMARPTPPPRWRRTPAAVPRRSPGRACANRPACSSSSPLHALLAHGPCSHSRLPISTGGNSRSVTRPRSTSRSAQKRRSISSFSSTRPVVQPRGRLDRPDEAIRRTVSHGW